MAIVPIGGSTKWPNTKQQNALVVQRLFMQMRTIKPAQYIMLNIGVLNVG